MIFFRHNSRLPEFRTPLGAAVCSQHIEIFAEIDGDAEVFLRLRSAENDLLIPMLRENNRVHMEMEAPEKPCALWYSFFIRDSTEQTYYYGADSGEGSFYMYEPPSWQITVYYPDFETPRWWCEGIVYQIFPDRFRRSSWEDFRARVMYHADLGRFVRLHDRWSEEICVDPSPGQDVYTPDDFFGGDLNGIREKLPYLASLGVTAIYLNPVFESASNHRYDTADYLKIDPFLGNEQDFINLCEEARTYHMQIMLDGVFSHTGADSRYFDKYHRYDESGACSGMESPYFSWYHFRHYPDEYDCWWNFPSLPNVNEYSPSYQDFVIGEQGVLSYWEKRGTSNWRLDVADELPDSFIRLIRSRLKAINPESVLLGEVWEDCSNKYSSEGRRCYVDGDTLDGAMNYPFATAVIGFLTEKIDAYALNELLQTQRERYPKPFYEACLNLLDSHDTVRALTALAGAPDRHALSRTQQALYRLSDEQATVGRIRLVMAVSLQMTMPGVPCVYYGDEIGLEGMADPFNRAPYPWGDEDVELMKLYCLLTSARKNHVELKRGFCRMGALLADVFCIVRYLALPDEISILFVNRCTTEQTVVLEPERLREGVDANETVYVNGIFQDVLTGEIISCSDILTATIPPLTARLYTR